MSEQILISLCISTFNRCEILNNTIQSITSDKAFDETVEIVVGDNGSTDNTPEICKKYAEKYPNFRYYRNNENIAIYNFSKVLMAGSGLYLKLLNDTQTLQGESLAYMKEKIVQYKNSGYNIIFAQKWGVVKDANLLLCNNPIELMRILSYHSTWSGNFGAYRCLFSTIKDVDETASLMLPQVDWLYQICNRYGTIVTSSDYYDVVNVTKKGTYSFFETFTTNYFKTLLRNIPRGWYFEREKCILYCKHIVPFYYLITRKGSGYDYNIKGAMKHVLHYYWYYPYTYRWYMIYMLYRFLKSRK